MLTIYLFLSYLSSKEFASKCHRGSREVEDVAVTAEVEVGAVIVDPLAEVVVVNVEGKLNCDPHNGKLGSKILMINF